MNAAVRTDPLSHYRTQFDSVRGALPGAPAARARAFARFLDLGFPTGRDEAWKYTNLRRLEARSFVPASRADSMSVTVPTLAEVPASRLVFVNGFLRDDILLPRGLRARSAQAFEPDRSELERSTGVPAGGGTEQFAALNAAFTTDPLVIDVAAATAVETGLHVAFISGGRESTMSHPRLSLHLEAGARLCLVIEHLGPDDGERWVNGVVDISLARDASLDLYRLQRHMPRTFHIERIDARLAEDARLTVHDVSVGASLARLDINVSLEGARAAAEATGVFFVDGTQHLDTHVQVDHRAVGATSLQEYRGIAAGRGRGVFNTKVVVHSGAQKSNARQSSRNLLLTGAAEIDTKPELEIYADDVQCGHGATTGQLDPAALFYLRSRGIALGEARRALTRAFAGSVLARMTLAGYAAIVHRELDARLDKLLEAIS